MKNSTTEILSDHNLSLSLLKPSLDSLFSDPVEDLILTSLEGDASTRHYYRLSFRRKRGTPEKLIVMQLESPQPAKEPDYVKLTRFLDNLGLPVPQLHCYDDTVGLLLVEDCGDILFKDVVYPNKSLQEVRIWYEKAISLLVQMQQVCTERIGIDCCAFNRRFDAAKLMWEFDFMLTHYVEGMKKDKLALDDRNQIRSGFQSICASLAAEKPCFTHRDYHSRNLMIKDGALKIIDFQDARMGPCQYDLASLLRDSYVELEENLVCSLIEYYILSVEKVEGRKIHRERFRRIFDLMAVQRNLKAVGTFAYQKVVRGTDRYLDDIPRTLSYVKKALDGLPDLFKFQQALGRYIPAILRS